MNCHLRQRPYLKDTRCTAPYCHVLEALIQATRILCHFRSSPYPRSASSRASSSASSKRWQARQATDRSALRAKVQGLKSRAAFKLLEVRSSRINHDVQQTFLIPQKINEKYRLFKSGQTVVDLVNAH